MYRSTDLSSGSFYSTRLVGREVELSLLRDAYARALAGHGNLVLISGEAGIGKTTLVQELVSEAKEQGALVLTGAAYDLSATPPYGPWLELTDRYHSTDGLPELPTALKRGTGLGDLPSQLALFEVARDFFEQISEGCPLVLILEDLHWSDQASLDGLRYISRAINEQRTLIIATYRDDEITRKHPFFLLIPALVREATAARIELRPLTEPAIIQLVDNQFELGPADRDSLVEYLLEWSEGNPLFIDELLRTLERRGTLQHAGPDWQLSDLPDIRVPSLIQQLIEGRLASIGERSASVIKVATMIGQRIPLAILESMADAAALEPAIEDALAAGLIREIAEPAGFAFRHALVREAIYSTIPLHERRTLHGNLAELFMNQSRQDAEAISYHLKQAGDGRAAEWLIRAGEQAERTFAWQEAFARYNAALTVLYELPESDATIAGLMLKTARLLRFLDPEQAGEYLNTARRLALTCGEDTIAAAAQFNIGTNLCNLGDFSRGLREMNEAIETLASSPENADLIIRWTQTSLSAQADPIQAWLGSLAMNLSTAGRFHEAIEVGQRSLRINWDEIRSAEVAKKLASHTHSSLDAYEAIGVAMAALGDPVEAKYAFDLSQEIHRRLNYGPSRVIVSSLELIMSHFPYRTTNLPERARLAEIIGDHLQISSGMVGNQNAMWGYEHYLVHTGRWNQLRELVEAGIRPELFEYRFVSATARSRLFRYLGEYERAWNLLNDILKDGVNSAPDEHVLLVPAEPLRIAAGLAFDTGDFALARDCMAAHDSWLDWSGAVLGRAEGLLVWAKLHLVEGDADTAREYAQRAHELACDPEQPFALISIHRFLGELFTRGGDLDAAVDHLQQSLDLARSCEIPFERALTLLALAELRVAERRADESRTLIDEVRSICVPLGANPTLERVATLAAIIRADTPQHANPFSLTAREIEVLRLLVQGMTDREIADELFISRHTVMRHVSHILAKLDVDSRTAAAALAVRDRIV